MNDEKRIELEKKFSAMSLSDLVKELDEVKEEHDRLKSVASAVGEVMDYLRLSIIPERMEEEDISTVTVAGVGRVSLQGDIYFSIPADHRVMAYDWLREHGHGDIIQETVNSSTGKAFAKEMMKAGQMLPEDIFKVTPFTRAQLTRIKN